jgi:hypothetical protein
MTVQYFFFFFANTIELLRNQKKIIRLKSIHIHTVVRRDQKSMYLKNKPYEYIYSQQ